MKKLKHLVLTLLLLSIAGCGCGDSGGGGGTPQAQPAEFRLSTQFPPCPLPIPPTDDPICEIDVFFLLDDSFFMLAEAAMGLIPNEPDDHRSRQLVARRVFSDLRDRLKTEVETQALALIASGDLPANIQFDFAFGVGRYEDYGNTGVEYGEFVPLDGAIDGPALPFMLNMPLLREEHDDFLTLFDPALEDAVTPGPLGGDGSVLLDIGGRVQDPQSAIEALFQIATGTGFNGNGDLDTTDNGGPCSLSAQGLLVPAPPLPAGTWDVPAVTYGDGGVDPQDNNRPVFTVLDENGVQADPACIASGDVGGVGWRANSLRWVLLTSDVASIGVFPNAPGPGERVEGVGGVNNDTVPVEAFDGVTGRWGEVGTTNSPENAATVQETIDALIAQDIEVICLGAPRVAPGQTKPNVPIDPVVPPDLPDRVPAIEDPALPASGPYTWMSAVSILTGSKISDDSGEFARLFPAVFNLGNVGLLAPGFDPILGAPSRATAPTTDVLFGLVERILDEAQNKEFTGGGSDVYPLLPTLVIEAEVQMIDNLPGFLFTRSSGLQTETVEVQIPTYYSDGAGNDFTVDASGNPVPGRPATSIITWQDWEYTLSDPVANPPPQSDQLPFDFVISATEVTGADAGAGDRPSNEVQIAQLLAKLGVSTPQFQPVPLTDADGTLQLTSWPQNQPAPLPRGVVMVNGTYNGWCSMLKDLTWGVRANFPAEPFGVCTDVPPAP